MRDANLMCRSIVAVLAASVLATLGPSGASAATGVPGREADPIVLDGSNVPGLLGSAPSRIVAFAWDGRWQQVPVQVDERAVIDYPTVRQGHQTAGRPFSALAYTDPGTFAGPDPDPSLDGDDEIAAMAMDAGEQAPSGFAPAGTASGSLTELRIVDSVSPGPTHFLYLFRSDGYLDPAAGRSYVSYDFRLFSGDYKSTYDFSGIADNGNGPPANPEDSTVSTDYYLQHLGSRWIEDALHLRAGGASGVDILDGDKAQVSYGCGRSELTFSRGGGGYIANISGPVRAIRSYIGANSGTYTQQDRIYYQREEVVHTYLRVHPGINVISQFADYSPAANGMTYRNSAKPAGVTIDGVPDPSMETGPALGPQVSWEQATGPQGTVSIVSRYATDIDGLQLGSFYQDDSTSPAIQQCGGYADDQAWGSSGPVISMPPVPGGVNTDPTRTGEFGPASMFSATRTTFYSGPGGDAALAARRSAQVDAPLRVSLGSGMGNPEVRTRVRAPKRLAVGRRAKVRVRVRNNGTGKLTGLRICGKGPHKLVKIGRCAKISRIAPGRAVKVRLKLRLRKRAAKHRSVRVRVKGSGDGFSFSDRVKIRVKRPRHH